MSWLVWPDGQPDKALVVRSRFRLALVVFICGLRRMWIVTLNAPASDITPELAVIMARGIEKGVMP